MNNRKETESLNLILSPIDLFSVLKYNLLTFFIIHPLINDKLPLSLLESKDKAVLQHKKIGIDIHIYTGKAGVGKSPNQSFLFI